MEPSANAPSHDEVVCQVPLRPEVLAVAGALLCRERTRTMVREASDPKAARG